MEMKKGFGNKKRLEKMVSFWGHHIQNYATRIKVYLSPETHILMQD